MAPMHSREDDLKLIHRMADRAADVIMPFFRAIPAVENKEAEGFDPVTAADKGAEEAIRALLSTERPDDGVLGEEFAPLTTRNGRTWILDPIDGTRGFICGLPTWGVLMALYEEGTPTLGMMAQPFVGERFYANADGAFHAWSRGVEPMKTRRCRGLSEAIVACTAHHHFDDAMRTKMLALNDKVRMVRYGTDCYGYALLAAGHVDVVVETRLQAYDIAPFIPIIERAGGQLFDRHGVAISDTILSNYGGDGIAVGDPSLKEALLDALA
ncbi:MAG: inositol monophosphatase family protein [Pseudomonadota bacterium]